MTGFAPLTSRGSQQYRALTVAELDLGSAGLPVFHVALRESVTAMIQTLQVCLSSFFPPRVCFPRSESEQHALEVPELTQQMFDAKNMPLG